MGVLLCLITLTNWHECYTGLQESVLKIEYVEQQPAPEPEDSLLHDDWVSCVRASGD